MMNEYLNDALGEISDEKIAEAINGKKTKRLTFLKVASAACIVIAVAAALVFANADKPETGDSQAQCQADAVSTAAAIFGDSEPMPGEDEIYQEKKWEEKENNEKYGELSFNGETYITTGMKAEKAEIGNKLGTAKAKGFDIYADKSYETDCVLYPIGSFDSEFLVAVKFGSDDNYYPYKAEDWFPSDLGNFCDTLNFFENIRFDSEVILSSDHYADSDKIRLNENGKLFDDVSKILNINSNTKALEYTSENEPEDGERILEFGVSSPLLSRYSLFLTVSEDGYIMTNLVDAGVSFFVGRDAVKTLFETADKTGGEKYVKTTIPPYPPESEQTVASQTAGTTFSPNTDAVATDGEQAIEVTEAYSQYTQQEE